MSSELKFDDLKTSTITMMVYSNMIFDYTEIFKKLKITKVETPLTKKIKNVDKKKIVAPRGAIIGCQSLMKVEGVDRVVIRGIDTRRKKNYWCCNCKPTKLKMGKETKVKKVIRRPGFKVKDTDIWAEEYYCTTCGTVFELKDVQRIVHFLNQTTIILSLGGNKLVNIMLSNTTMKMAGCKSYQDAIECTKILWENFIKDTRNYKFISPKETQPKFLFDMVMMNLDFKLGFPIDKIAFNDLMNEQEYIDRGFISQCEITSSPNVNIKMPSVKPKQYDVLVYDNTEGITRTLETMSENKYKTKKNKKTPYTTFIVFSSSEVILSGRCKQNMRSLFNEFVNIAMSNRKRIEERVCKYQK